MTRSIVQTGFSSSLPNVFQHALDCLFNGRRAEDHYVGMSLSGPDVTLRHGSYRRMKLLDHRLRGAAAFAHITLLAALQANVIRHVHVHPGAQKAAQTGPMQGKQTLEDHKWRRLKWLRHCGAGVERKIIGRYLDGRSFGQLLHLRNQQLVFEGCRIVKVAKCALR